MKPSSTLPRFSIIHHYLSPNSAITLDGFRVERQTTLWYDEYDDEGRPYNGRFIATAPDDTHFVYTDPNWKNVVGRSRYVCTCGSIAVIVGSNVYAGFGSPSTEGTIRGEMICCKHFADYGYHSSIKP